MTNNQRRYREYLGSEYWQEVRQEMYNRSGGRCELCGERGRLEVHHTDYSVRGNELDHLNTLQHLCPTCHATRPGHPLSPERIMNTLERMMRGEKM